MLYWYQLHCAWFSSIIHINSYWSFIPPWPWLFFRSRYGDMGFSTAITNCIAIMLEFTLAYWDNEPSAWSAKSWAHYLTLLLTCTISGSMAACWWEQLHYHATWSQLSAQTKHTLMSTKAIIVRSGFMSHSDWPSQVIVTLMWANNPTPEGLPHSKFGIYLGWQTKFKAHWVIHGNNCSTHTLHPTLRIAYDLLHQEGQVPPPASPAITNCTFVPAQEILFLPFFFLLLSLTFKQTSNYSGASVLRCQPWHTMTTNNPTVIVQVGII